MRSLGALLFCTAVSGWLCFESGPEGQDAGIPPILNLVSEQADSEAFDSNRDSQPTIAPALSEDGTQISDDSVRWSRFVEGHRRNQDPDGIIQIRDGVVHMYADAEANTVQPYGYLCTDTDFENYDLQLEYRWGLKKFQPRLELPRDAGVLFHVSSEQGAIGIWPQSVELQIQEGDTGDIATVKTRVRTTINASQESIQFSQSQDAREVTIGDAESVIPVRKSAPHETDGWNTVELRVRGDSAEYLVNGQIVNRCWGIEKPDSADPSKWGTLRRGRILLQAEGAEVEYRKIQLRQVADSQPIVSRNRPQPLRVGAATASFTSDDKMQIAGGIGPRYVQGQEGELRAVAVVLEQPGSKKLAIVGCDVLFVTRAMIDRVTDVIEKSCGIPSSHILVNATHTHHAPSTIRVHGCDPEEEFVKSVEEGIVRAVELANSRLVDDCQFFFSCNPNVQIGKNSRILLSDNMISWVGNTSDAIRETGPFDPELPVLTFRDRKNAPIGAIFNHSTHTIGTRAGNVRSPSFYGLSAQEMEQAWGAPICFLEGASGSTHNYTHSVDDAISTLNSVLKQGLEHGEPRSVTRLGALKKPFRFRVRRFDEGIEDDKVISYLSKRAPDMLEICMQVFRQMRKELQPLQNEERETWLQVMCIGDVAIVGVPAEFFTVFGLEIKKQSPFKNTYIAELANDWIGYLPNREAHELGGYQTWTGLHSYAEIGTGERIVDEVVSMLKELAESK